MTGRCQDLLRAFFSMRVALAQFSPPSHPKERFKVELRSGWIPVWKWAPELRPLSPSALPHGQTIAGASILPLNSLSMGYRTREVPSCGKQA
jgi:hypothetical protein